MLNLQDNKNKIALILTIFLLVILVFFVASFFYSGKGLSLQQPTSEKTNGNQEQHINKQVVTPTRATIIADNQDKIATTDCEKISDSVQKSECNNLATVNSSLVNLDYGACKKLDQKWQDVCIYKVVGRASSGRIDQSAKCALIKDKLIRSLCYKYAAAMLDKVKLCDRDEIDKDECVGYTIDFNNHQGLAGCEAIKTGSWFYTCVMKNKGDCSVMKDKELATQCQSWQLFNKIIASKKSADCAQLPIEVFRQVCESESNSQDLGDANGNGVNNYEELIFGFDPFATSSAAAKIIQQENLISSFTSLYDQTVNNLSQLILNKAADSKNKETTIVR